jgi:hypothetical protein
MASETRTQQSPGKRRLYWLAAVPVVLVAFGLAADLMLGLPIVQHARSPLAAMLGLAGLGVLYVVGEWVGDRIHARDSTDQPLWRRVLHLAALLLSAVLLLAAMWLLVMLAR